MDIEAYQLAAYLLYKRDCARFLKRAWFKRVFGREYLPRPLPSAIDYMIIKQAPDPLKRLRRRAKTVYDKGWWLDKETVKTSWQAKERASQPT